MICALLVDPNDSIDFPDNGAEVLGRPLSAYPLIAAKRSDHVRRIYAQTASPVVRRTSAQYGAVLLTMPPETNHRPSDAAQLLAGWREIVDDLKAENAAPELLVVLYANTGAIHHRHIDEGIEALLDDPSLDSAVTVSPYQRWTPRRAFREEDGRLAPFAPGCASEGVPWFPDWGAQVLRPRLLDKLTPDCAELSWLGEKVKPLKQAGGGPVDYAWQVPKMEYWLMKQGFSATPRPEPMPKPLPAPKPDRR